MIDGVLFLLCWMLFPLFWGKMLNGVGLSLFRISIPGVFVVVMYIFQYAGLPLAYFELENISQNHIREGVQTVWKVFIYISVTISFIITGYIVAARMVKNNAQRLTERLSLKFFIPSSTIERRYILLLSGLAIYVLVDYCIIIGFSNIALFNLFDAAGSGYTTEKLRSLMGTEFTGKYHWYYYFMKDLLSWMLFATYADYLVKPSSAKKSRRSARIPLHRSR